MRDNDGNRLFINVKENPDFKKYIKTNLGDNIRIEKIEILDNKYLKSFKKNYN